MPVFRYRGTLVLLMLLAGCGSSPRQGSGLPEGPPHGRGSAVVGVDYQGDYPTEPLAVTPFHRIDPRFLGQAHTAPSLFPFDDQLLLSGYGPRLLAMRVDNGRIDPVKTPEPGPVYGVSVYENHLAFLTRDRIWVHREGQMALLMDLDEPLSPQPGRALFPSRFAFAGDRVLVPRDGSQASGNLVDLKGRTIARAVDSDLIAGDETRPRATHWGYADGLWVAAYSFYPRLVIFDPDLNRVDAVDFHSPATLAYDHRREKAAAQGADRILQRPLFTHLEVRNGAAFLLSRGWFHRVDLTSAEVKVYLLHTSEQTKTGKPKRFKFSSFALVADRLVVGSGSAANGLFATPAGFFKEGGPANNQ